MICRTYQFTVPLKLWFLLCSFRCFHNSCNGESGETCIYLGAFETASFYDVPCGDGGINWVSQNQQCLDSKTNLTSVFLDHNLFPNGAYESLWDKHDVGATRTKKGYLILHNNWISGRMRKLECQVYLAYGNMIPDLECVCWQTTHSWPFIVVQQFYYLRVPLILLLNVYGWEVTFAHWGKHWSQ